MNLTLSLQVEVELDEEEEKACSWIEIVLSEACVAESLPSVEVSVLIVDNLRIQELNSTYRQIDKPTDVLSFPLWDKEEWLGFKHEAIIHLGDIVVSIDKAREQAKDYGHSLAREIGFLTVHGFLHLLGYDHKTEEEEKQMFVRQDEILESVGLSR